MDDFLKMDIFFGVTTVAVLVVSVLLVMVLLRLLRILKTVDEVSEIVQGEAEEIRDDIREVRANVKAELAGAGKAISMLTSFVKPRERRKKKETASS
ncbi:MAG: hypothetical protein V4644_01395 [Patescibacteria group bacterium]